MFKGDFKLCPDTSLCFNVGVSICNNDMFLIKQCLMLVPSVSLLSLLVRLGVWRLQTLILLNEFGLSR